jgi:hypothetical protein
MKLPLAVVGVVRRVALAPPEEVAALVTFPTSGAVWARPALLKSARESTTASTATQSFSFTTIPPLCLVFSLNKPFNFCPHSPKRQHKVFDN